MATMMKMEWNGVTPAQYHRIFSALGLDAHPAAGLIFHVAGFSEGHMHVLDLWESVQAFEHFQRDRLMSVVKAAGISTPPHVKIMPAHNIYAPQPDVLLRDGATSLPL